MTSPSVQTWLDRLTQPLLQVQAIVWQGHKERTTGQDATVSCERTEAPNSLLHCPTTRSSRTAFGTQARTRPIRAVAKPAQAQPTMRHITPELGVSTSSRQPTPLHVVQIRDDALSGKAGQRQNAGRMVISGRMADVCAQLERMAA